MHTAYLVILYRLLNVTTKCRSVSVVCRRGERGSGICGIHIAVVYNLTAVRPDSRSHNSYSNIITFIRGKYIIQKSYLCIEVHLSK